MKLKLDEQGHVVLQEGKPVYIKDDGREIAFDGKQAFDKIGQLTGENAATRQRAEEAEAKFKPFDGLDADIAKKALDTIRNIDDKKLVDAGKVEEVRAAAVKAYEEKLTAASAQHTTSLAELNGKLEKATNELYSEKIGGGFTRSKLIAERFAIPVDLVQARFGSAFKVENGQIVAYDTAGNKIYSPSRAGELANFDEALETLVDQYPYKDQILKGSGASGGGASGGGSLGSKVIGQAAFDALPPKERAAKMADGFSIQQ
jgi:hypothetical protein